MSSRTALWQQLGQLAEQAAATPILSLFDQTDRLKRFTCELEALYVDFSKHAINDETLTALTELAIAADVIPQAKAMSKGEVINQSEARAVTHMAQRSNQPDERILAQRESMQKASQQIREGSWTGITNAQFTDVVNIGIGGSHLGPQMVCEALREYHDGPTIHFVANVDGAEINYLLPQLDAATTLLIISSKSFTTGETLRNANTALDWLSSELGLEDPAASTHCVAVTAAPKTAESFGIDRTRILEISESIGGRYSTWSAIGLPVGLAIGPDGFAEFLRGGACMDEHFLTADPEQNLPLILGMIGIWYNNIIGVQSRAVVPYCERLGLFVDHLQQLDMESNGKSVDKIGRPISVSTAPVTWGQTGTNGQHAFFQMLHQGTQAIPVDFIGIANDTMSSPAHHSMLMNNMLAQAEALMCGRTNDNGHQHYPGNRPSTTLLLENLTPFSLGLLLALYEHQVFTQGCVWDINSFDQWGVELGKQLAEEMDTEQHDPSTLALKDRIST